MERGNGKDGSQSRILYVGLSTEARVNAEAHDCYLAGINVSDPSLILKSCLFGMVRIFEGKS